MKQCLTILVFLVTLEAGSWLILRYQREHFTLRPSGKSSWDEVEKLAAGKTSLSATARHLLAWKKTHPEISGQEKYSPHKHALGDYNYTGEKSGRKLFDGHYDLLAAGLDDEYILRTRDGSIKYRMKIRTDENGRRVTGHESGNGRIMNVIFLGCSITLGDGVDDESAFPSQFGKKEETVRTYNFGVTGASPATVLHYLQKKGRAYFRGIDPELPTVIVFTFIDDHFRRISGTSGFLRDNPSAGLMPYYYLSDGQLRKDGSFYSDPLKGRKLLQLLSYTNTHDLFGKELPSIGEDEYMLAAEIFRKMETEFRKHFPAFRKFYVVSAEPGVHTKEFASVLSREKISFIGNQDFDLRFLLKGRESLPADAHPSPLYYDLLADMTRLQLRADAVLE